MAPNFSTIRNGLEPAVFESVLYRAALYPSVAAEDELMSAVACIALNHLPPKYFHSSEIAVREDKAIDHAVLAAYDWVYARTALVSREPVRNIHAEIECAFAA